MDELPRIRSTLGGGRHARDRFPSTFRSHGRVALVSRRGRVRCRGPSAVHETGQPKRVPGGWPPGVAKPADLIDERLPYPADSDKDHVVRSLAALDRASITGDLGEQTSILDSIEAGDVARQAFDADSEPGRARDPLFYVGQVG